MELNLVIEEGIPSQFSNEIVLEPPIIKNELCSLNKSFSPPSSEVDLYNTTTNSTSENTRTLEVREES